MTLYIWGHSQGGQATEYTLALSGSYAPEFNVRAAAALAPSSDLIGTAQATFASSAPAVGLALSEAVAYAWIDYYGGTTLSTALLPPFDQSAREGVYRYCDSSFTDPIRAVKDPKEALTQGFFDTLAGGGIELWAMMSLPLPAKVPLFYATGEGDVTVPTAGNLPTVKRWCQEGLQVLYRACRGADHLAMALYPLGDVFTFFEDRQLGKPLTGTCQLDSAPVHCGSAP